MVFQFHIWSSTLPVNVRWNNSLDISHPPGHISVLLIPYFRPGGQRQRLTVKNSLLLVNNACKRASNTFESQRSVLGPCILQNALFVAT